MRRLLALSLALALSAPAPARAELPQAARCDRGKKKKKKDPPPVVAPPPSPAPSASPTPSPEPSAPPVARPPPAPVPTVSGLRKGSALVPGGVSRWSNAGAMEPIVSEVPITAPLPERAVPLLPGQATPGQRLTDTGERLTAHLSLFGDHLETVRQDTSDIDLVRARATIDYAGIGGSDFGLHLDLEYRGSAGARRLSDRRLHQLYASYGATDFRRADGPRFGVALGRLTVREAGWTQVDGGALRFAPVPELELGLFGGLSGNPYVYNWRLAKTEDFSLDWIAGGVFGSLRLGPIFADFAYALSLHAAGGGLDRMFATLDASWAARDDLDLYLNAWVDFIQAGTPIPRLSLLASWAPSPSWRLRASVSRWASVVYAYSTGYSFRIDPTGAAIGANQVVVDAAGEPVVAYDARSLQAVYDELAARVGFKALEVLEPYLGLSAQLREPVGDGGVERPALRLLPMLGLRFADPGLFELSTEATVIVDAATDRRLVLSAAIARELAGLRPSADVRAYVGGAGALEGGLELSYVLPRGLVPGRLLLRVMLRYAREDVTIARPPDRCLGANPDPTCAILGPEVVLPFVPLQESFYGYGGVDWRY